MEELKIWIEEVIRIKKNDIEKSRKYRCCYAK